MDLRLPNRSGRKDDRTRERVHIHYWISMNGYKEVLIALKCSRNNNVHVNIHVLVYINTCTSIYKYMYYICT